MKLILEILRENGNSLLRSNDKEILRERERNIGILGILRKFKFPTFPRKS